MIFFALIIDDFCIAQNLIIIKTDEMIVFVAVRGNSTILRAYSDYFEIITPASDTDHGNENDELQAILNVVLEIIFVFFGIMLAFLLISWCLHHTTSMNSGSDEEVINLRDSLRLVIVYIF